jgi:hypothetical protein
MFPPRDRAEHYESPEEKIERVGETITKINSRVCSNCGTEYSREALEMALTDELKEKLTEEEIEQGYWVMNWSSIACQNCL